MRLRSVVGTVGLLGVLLALSFALAPTTVRSIRPVAIALERLPTGNPKRLLLAVGFSVTLGMTVLSRSASASSDAVPSLIDRPPEAVQTAGQTGPGNAFDTQLDRRDGDHDSLTETLRTTAVETLVQQAGLEQDGAGLAVERGTWTDDRIAAAFLGTPRQPLVARLRGWLDPDAERKRRVERTVTAIESIRQEGQP